MNFKRNIIQNNMHYSEFENLDVEKEIVASNDIEVVDYKAFKSAYNPLYPDAGKVVKIPEDYLYNNTRHHLKDFVIVDGKVDEHGNHVIIGFLGTSQINKKSRALSNNGNSHEILGITKVIVDKTKYRQLIKKSRTMVSDKFLSNLQLAEIKNQSRTTANCNKSKSFRR